MPVKDDRDKVFSDVVRTVQRLEATWGKDNVKWAINKYQTAKREKEKLQKKKAELERELAQLDKVI